MQLNPVSLISLCLSLLFFSCAEQQVKPKEQATTSTKQEAEFAFFLDSLKRAGANDYEIINEIRQYLAQRVYFGNSRDSLVISYYKIPWNELYAFHCLAQFEKNELTGNCGLAAYVLAKLYDYAGYQNFIFNCGYAGTTATHEFNLVRLNEQLIIQDAFMNMTIADTTGNPKNFTQIIQEIKQGDFSDIKIVDNHFTTELWLDSLRKEVFDMYCENEAFQAQLSDVTIVDNRLRVMVNRDYRILSGAMMRFLQKNLQREGLYENFLSIYLKPMHLKDGNTGAPADSLMQAFTAITNSGSPD